MAAPQPEVPLTLSELLQSTELADIIVCAAGISAAQVAGLAARSLAIGLQPGVERLMAELADKMRICVIGGHSGRGPGPHAPNGAVAMLDPGEGAWWSPTTMQVPRLDCEAVAGEGLVYVLGGLDENGTSLRMVERLDLVRGRWERLPPMRTARHSFAAAMVSGAICVAGGMNEEAFEPMALAELYDVGAGAWRELPALPTARSACAAVSLDGAFYVFGGVNVSALDAAERLAVSGGTGAWTPLPAMLSARASCAAATSLAGAIYVAGGCSDVWSSLDTAERFDPGSREWVALPTMDRPRRDFAAVGCANSGAVYVLGGLSYANRGTALVQYLDVATQQWMPAPAMPVARSGCVAVAPWG